MEFCREFDVKPKNFSSQLIRRTRVATFYSNRVAVVVEQPVKIKFPFLSYTSAVPAELYAVPFDSNVTS